MSKELIKRLYKKIAVTGVGLIIVAGTSISCDAKEATPQTATPVPSEASATPTAEQLLTEHYTRLIELSKRFSIPENYPEEEVKRWLEAAGVTWETLTIHGLPYGTHISSELILGKRVPVGAIVGLGTKVNVKYPAYIDLGTAGQISFPELPSELQLQGAKKVDVYADGRLTTVMTNVELNYTRATQWTVGPTNVKIPGLVSAFSLKVDGTHIPELAPKYK